MRSVQLSTGLDTVQLRTFENPDRTRYLLAELESYTFGDTNEHPRIQLLYVYNLSNPGVIVFPKNRTAIEHEALMVLAAAVQTHDYS